jgi:hypothetical protein
MPIRLRKFIGAIALFVLVVVWALLAMALAQAPLVREHAIISVIYYIVAGIGWVLPAMPLVKWMSRDRNREPGVRDQTRFDI